MYLLCIYDRYDPKLKLSLSLIQCPLYFVIYGFELRSDLDPHCDHAGLLFWDVLASCQSSCQPRWMNHHFPLHAFLPVPGRQLFLEGCHASIGSCAAAPVCSALLRPLSVVSDELSTDPSRLKLQSLSQMHPEPQESPNQSPDSRIKSSRTPEVLRSKTLHYMDYSLIVNPRFKAYWIFALFAVLVFFALALFLVLYICSQGIEDYKVAALMSISTWLAGFCLVGWPIWGWWKSFIRWQWVWFFWTSILLAHPLAITFTQLALFSSAYVPVFGTTMAVHITVLAGGRVEQTGQCTWFLHANLQQ